MEKHFCWHIAHFFSLKMSIPDDPVSSSEINQHLRLCIVHGQGKAISFHTSFICKGPCHRFSQRNARVFYGVMLINMQVSMYTDFEIHFSMPGNLIQHMIEKSKAGMNI